jgi:hypothetical protein
VMEVLSPQAVADEAARLVAIELRHRDIPVSYGGGFKTVEEIVGGKSWPAPGFFHTSVKIEPTTIDLTASLEDFSKKWLQDAAIELGIKIARPFPVETFDLETPMGVDYQALGQAFGVSLQMIRAFDINNSEFVMRLGMLVRWQEADL